MRKLFFIAMIVLGTSLAQAQVQDGDYLRYFRFATTEAGIQDRSHLYSDDLDHCPSNLAQPGTVIEYTLDRSTGQFYVKNGDAAPVTLGAPFEGRQLRGYINTFNRTGLNQVFTTGRRGNVTGEITGFTTN